MHHHELYLRLAEGTGEPAPDQRSIPRSVLVLLCTLLVLLASPLVGAGTAFGDERGDAVAVRLDDEGRDDDDDDDDTDTSARSSDVRGTTAQDTDRQARFEQQVTEAGDPDRDATGTTTSNRAGTTRSRTTTGRERQAQVTETGASSRDTSGTTTSNRDATTRSRTTTGA